MLNCLVDVNGVVLEVLVFLPYLPEQGVDVVRSRSDDDVRLDSRKPVGHCRDNALPDIFNVWDIRELVYA